MGDRLGHPAHAIPTRTSTRRARSANLDLVVVQDLFLNETAREIGTVFLPACSSFEKDGTFMNSERRDPARAQRRSTRAASRSPTGNALPGRRRDGPRRPVLVLLGAGDLGRDPAGLARGRGDHLRAARRERGLQWPCPTRTIPGTQILHSDRSRESASARALAPMPYLPPATRPPKTSRSCSSPAAASTSSTPAP